MALRKWQAILLVVIYFSLSWRFAVGGLTRRIIAKLATPMEKDISYEDRQRPTANSQLTRGIRKITLISMFKVFPDICPAIKRFHMKGKLSLLLLILITTNTAFAQPIQLFNGKDLHGWHADIPEMDTNTLAKSPFIIRNGMLVSLGTPNGHLITDSVYSNYRLVVEYRFADKPGNCGVLLHASTPRALYKMFPKSIEAQMMSDQAGDFWCIQEDIKTPDMEKRRGPKEEWGVSEGKKRRILNLTDGSEKPLGEWNRMIVECVGSSIRVWVNDDLVNDGFNCTANHGQVALQAEGAEVEFRRVELLPINELSNHLPSY